MTLIDTEHRLTQVTSKTTALTVCCWGSAGSGKSTLAANLAFELAAIGLRVALIDADTYHPSQSALLGITEPGPGITACLRLSRQDRFDEVELERLAHVIEFDRHQIWYIPGLNSIARWPEVDALSLTALSEALYPHFEVLIWDIASYLETGVMDIESGALRNQAALHLISTSQLALATFCADPVGVNRFLFDIGAAGRDLWPIANRVRSSVLGRSATSQVAKTLREVAKVELFGALEEDSGIDEMLRTTRPLILQGKSKARAELQRIASRIAASC